MKRTKNVRTTISCSIEAWRKIGEIAPTQKQTTTITQILESIVKFKGDYYELLARIAVNKE